MLGRKFTLCKWISATVTSLLLAVSAFGAIIEAQKPASYTDEKTGITIVTGEVTLTGIHRPELLLGASSPITQLVMPNLKVVEEKEDDIDYDDYRRGRLPAILDPKAKVMHRFSAILLDKNAPEAIFTLTNNNTDEKQQVRIDLQQAQKQEGPRKDFEQWGVTRLFSSRSLTSPQKLPWIYKVWLNKAQEVYGTEVPRLEIDPFNDDEDSNTDLIGSLAIFGGQVAINETLQTKLLDYNDAQHQDNKAIVPISELGGVEVKAHPYEAMLAELQAKSLPPAAAPQLANYVPQDRLLISIQSPKEAVELLDSGDTLFTRLAPLLGSGFANYDLIAHYTGRLGLSPLLLKQWILHNNIDEVALFTPDVFFLDNTDITAIVHFKENGIVSAPFAERLIDKIYTIPTDSGKEFYLAAHGNLWLLSTHKAELEKSLALVTGDNAASLGQSPEFQVMNYKLPLNETSKAYVYFSDPFIRRLTGPEVKIGQLRRAIARNQMQTITAMALLYRMDHQQDAPDIATLLKQGYLNEQDIPDTNEYTLEKGARVTSKTWGSLDNLKTLQENPINFVTEPEALSYTDYRDGYTQYWREYFDPIAVRLDINTNNTIALETFILPLIDNSIYMGLQETLGHEPPQQTQIPIYDQKPIAMMALHIPSAVQEMQDSILYELPNELRYTVRVDELLPLFGQTLVVSLQDSAPVIQSTLPGLVSLSRSNRFMGMRFRGEELLFIPIISSVLTRPIDLAIQVKDEELARKALKYIPSHNSREFSFNTSYDEQKNQWQLDTSLLGILQISFSLRIENGWLHISNHPWNAPNIIGTQDLPPNHATIAINASQLKEGLPQLAAIAQGVYRESVYDAASEILPWMMAYQTDVNNALTLQKAALGRVTPLPTEAELVLQYPLEVKPYGNRNRQKTTKMDMQQDAAFAHLLQNLQLWVRFEDDGLRSRAEFTAPLVTQTP